MIDLAAKKSTLQSEAQRIQSAIQNLSAQIEQLTARGNAILGQLQLCDEILVSESEMKKAAPGDIFLDQPPSEGATPCP